MHFNRPRDNTCNPPFQWYVCEANGFKGCCSDTAVCDLDTCPIANRPGNASPLASMTLAPIPISTPQGISHSTTSSNSGSTLTVSLGASGTSAVSQGSSDSPTGTVTTDETTRGSSKTPLIAGTVGAIVGAVFIFVILAFIWVCLRRKRKAKEEEKKTLGYYVAPGTRNEAQGNGSGKSYLIHAFGSVLGTARAQFFPNGVRRCMFLWVNLPQKLHYIYFRWIVQ